MIDFFQQLISSLSSLPPNLVYTVIGLLGAVENVLPPVPADTGIALGAFLSHSGPISATAVFLVTWSANVTSASLVYGAARSLGRDFFRGRIGRLLLSPRHFARLERIYDRFGPWGIFFSRFIPGVRAVVSPFAGIAGLSAPRALIPVAVASGIWYGTLTFVAARVAGELDAVLIFISRFNTTALIAAAATVFLFVGIAWRRKTQRER